MRIAIIGARLSPRSLCSLWFLPQKGTTEATEATEIRQVSRLVPRRREQLVRQVTELGAFAVAHQRDAALGARQQHEQRRGLLLGAGVRDLELAAALVHAEAEPVARDGAVPGLDARPHELA